MFQLSLVINISLLQASELDIHAIKWQLEWVLLDEVGHDADYLTGRSLILSSVSDDETDIENVDFNWSFGDLTVI